VLDRIREILKVDETASPKPRRPVNGVVLDASAILAVAFNEAGSATVMKHRANAFISTANQMEVISKFLRFEIALEESDFFLSETFPTVITFDKHQATLAAEIHQSHRQHQLSYADSSCLALAKLQGIRVLTGDRNWTTLPLEVGVQLIR
jgi:PIN domain nuclease of toxin-antitoxin system